MNKIIGFIGTGNMAKAIIGGILTAGLAEKTQIICSNNTSDKLEEAKKTYGIMTTLDNKEVAKKADILFLSVKPQVYKDIIDEIKGILYVKDIIKIVWQKDIRNWHKKQKIILMRLLLTMVFLKNY